MKLYSVAEYAKKLKISRQAMLKKVINNSLPAGISAQKVGSIWVLIEK
jgi:hypothetical protein